MTFRAAITTPIWLGNPPLIQDVHPSLVTAWQELKGIEEISDTTRKITEIMKNTLALITSLSGLKLPEEAVSNPLASPDETLKIFQKCRASVENYLTYAPTLPNIKLADTNKLETFRNELISQLVDFKQNLFKESNLRKRGLDLTGSISFSAAPSSTENLANLQEQIHPSSPTAEQELKGVEEVFGLTQQKITNIIQIMKKTYKLITSLSGVTLPEEALLNQPASLDEILDRLHRCKETLDKCLKFNLANITFKDISKLERCKEELITQIVDFKKQLFWKGIEEISDTIRQKIANITQIMKKTYKLITFLSGVALPEEALLNEPASLDEILARFHKCRTTLDKYLISKLPYFTFRHMSELKKYKQELITQTVDFKQQLFLNRLEHFNKSDQLEKKIYLCQKFISDMSDHPLEKPFLQIVIKNLSELTSDLSKKYSHFQPNPNTDSSKRQKTTVDLTGSAPETSIPSSSSTRSTHHNLSQEAFNPISTSTLFSPLGMGLSSLTDTSLPLGAINPASSSNEFSQLGMSLSLLTDSSLPQEANPEEFLTSGMGSSSADVEFSEELLSLFAKDTR